MGLDSNLYAERFFWKDDEKKKVRISGIPGFEIKKLDKISMDVGYWRKANHIHGWFVANCQDGNDDCGRHYVSRDGLKELRTLCLKCLEFRKVDGTVDESKVSKLLPTQSGFFFGGTDYDMYYGESLQHTVDVIDMALGLPEEWDFYYQSGW
jgi:hypothetical protein